MKVGLFRILDIASPSPVEAFFSLSSRYLSTSFPWSCNLAFPSLMLFLTTLPRWYRFRQYDSDSTQPSTSSSIHYPFKYFLVKYSKQLIAVPWGVVPSISR